MEKAVTTRAMSAVFQATPTTSLLGLITSVQARALYSVGRMAG